MIFTKFKKKLPLYLVTGLLVFGVVLVIGFLSFTGMLSIYASIGFAIGAFLLAGLVEGEVYAQNISQSFAKLFGKHTVASTICHQHLKRLSKDNPTNAFLKEYADLEKAIHKLEHKLEKKKAHPHKKVIDDLTREELTAEEIEDKLEKKRKILWWMQQYFKSKIEAQTQDDKELTRVITPKLQAVILTEITWKTRLSRFCFAISLVAGIGYGFVFLHVAPESIAACINYFHLILSPSWELAVTIGIYVFAVVAAAGFMLLVYNNLTAMVMEYDGSASIVNKIKDFFSRKEAESMPAYLFRIGFWVLLSLIIIGLATYATVTTGATWWHEAQAGIAFIMPYLGQAAVWICGITVAVMGVTALQFNLLNSFRAIDALGRGSPLAIKAAVKKIDSRVSETYANEGFVQFCNPFRMLIIVISIPFKVLVFLGHIISTGLVGEESNLLPDKFKGLTTALNSLVDALVDGFFLFSEDDHEEGHGGHNHSHAGIPELFLKVILLPLTFLSAGWSFTTQFLRCESKEEDTMSFPEACLAAGVPAFFVQPFLPTKGEKTPPSEKPAHTDGSEAVKATVEEPVKDSKSKPTSAAQPPSEVFETVLSYRVEEKSTRKGLDQEGKIALQERYRSIITA